MEKIKISEIALKVLTAAMRAIKANGGEMRLKDIIAFIETNVPLSAYEKEPTKSGAPRWKNALQYYSIDATKAGFLIKQKGQWILTDEGALALAKGDKFFMDETAKAYDQWASTRQLDSQEDIPSPQAQPLDEVMSQADEGIREFIKLKNPYEFQFLVAALLRAMGYYTPFIAPKGRDGGIDVIAYQDPLGTVPPTLKVQVKHYPSTAITVDVVRSLMGLLSKDSDVGLVVTSGTFTSEAIKEARRSHQRIRLIDIDELLQLWISYYDKMPEQDKSLLPIVPIYFLKPDINE